MNYKGIMQITLSCQEKMSLESLHGQTRDRRVADRIKAVLLSAEGWSMEQIAQALRLHLETVRAHLKEYAASQKLKPANGGSQSKLGADESYKEHSPIIKISKIREILEFLEKGARELSIKSINLYFHGGEPLLQKRKDFDEMCFLFREKLNFLRLDLSVQTNGVLINEDWIALFKKHTISVGVSIDGKKEDHDRYRVDHKGRGSYERVKKGLSLLKERSLPFGVLAVISSEAVGKDVYNHFVKELGVTQFDALLPDFHYEKVPSDLMRYTNFLCEIFDAWIEDDNPKVRIRFLSTIIGNFLGKNTGFMNFGPIKEDTAAITISSNGDLSPDDTLRSTHQEVIHRNAHIETTSLSSFLEDKIFKKLYAAKTNLPKACRECTYKKICAGGEPINRYKKDNGFDNPSTYCEGLKEIYEKVAVYLLQNGAPKEKILNALYF